MCARPSSRTSYRDVPNRSAIATISWGMGKGFFEAVREAELEGMVAKRRRSKYAGVLNDDWLKIRCMRVHDFVIGPWVSNGDEQMGTLLLGEFVEGVLRYVGTVGSPSDSRVMRSIARLLSRRAISPSNPLQS